MNFTFDVTTSRVSGFGLLDWTGDKTIATLKTTLQTLALFVCDNRHK